jgi:phenylacetate-CoA ligase
MKRRSAADLTRPAWRRIGRRIVLRPIDWMLRWVGPSYRLFFKVITVVPQPVQHKIGLWRARRAREHAARRVPAYGTFLAAQSYPSDPDSFIEPYTDKENYVKAFSTAARCVDGHLSFRDAAIDESSGSTGTPYNWVRSLRERQESHIFISHFARFCFGDEPWITINAFSMGAWATGINMGVALQRNSIVKNTGPDLDKIFRTLEFFGSDHPYLLCGYPPFLKLMIDEAEEQGFPLAEYRLMALVGGEGMSEGLRDYLRQAFEPVYSGYGATDIEIGLAGESPMSVAIRREARTDPAFRESLFGPDSRLPMVFQYNPLQHHITVTPERELVFTVNRLHMLSPRIMYNIHDEGGVATFAEMRRRADVAGVELVDLVPEKVPRLPFVWVYGRKDSTVSVMGANIYPEDLEQCLYDEPELARVTRSYCLGVSEDEHGTWRPLLSFEIPGEIDDSLQGRFEERIVARLRDLNRDFQAAMEEYAEGARPVIALHPLGGGPFARDGDKIKQIRLLTTGRDS